MKLRYFLSAAVLFALALAVSRGAHAQVPTSGACPANAILGTWNFNSNGHQGAMNVLTLNAAGQITGNVTFPGNVVQQIRGFWSASQCKVFFYRAIGGTPTSTPPENIQIYSGYMYPYSSSNIYGPRRIAGYFEAFWGTGGRADRHLFAWDASR